MVNSLRFVESLANLILLSQNGDQTTLIVPKNTNVQNEFMSRRIPRLFDN